MAPRAIALGNLLEDLVTLDTPEARREALTVIREFVATVKQLNFMFGMFAINALALLAARAGQRVSAAALLGYADLAYARSHRGLGPNAARLRAQLLARLQADVSPDDLHAWMAHGAALSADQICQLLLALDSPSASADRVSEKLAVQAHH
jgi:hypothetical protein